MANAPLKIKVGPVLYTVAIVEDLKNDEGQDLFGQCHHGLTTIKLNPLNVPSQHFLTLWHEVIHCFENVYYLTLTEEQVNLLSTAVVLAILDNPILRGEFNE